MTKTTPKSGLDKVILAVDNMTHTEVKDLLNLQGNDVSDSNDSTNSSDIESAIIKKIQ